MTKRNELCFVTVVTCYIHACMHTYIHAYIHTYIHKYIRTYVHTYQHTYIHTYIHINMYGLPSMYRKHAHGVQYGDSA